MRHISKLIVIIILSVFSSRAGAQTFSMTDAKWLIGKWENQTQRGRMVEEWTRTNDSVFSARSYMINAQDTILLESVQLKKEGNELFYIPTVKGQNNEQPVRFKLSAMKAGSMVFENPAHDFPQKISYTLLDKDSLMAEISGIVNGVERKRQFPMKRF
jgi:hypothetical protein